MMDFEEIEFWMRAVTEYHRATETPLEASKHGDAIG